MLITKLFCLNSFGTFSFFFVFNSFIYIYLFIHFYCAVASSYDKKYNNDHRLIMFNNNKKPNK